jgi:hypothetical protein
LDREEAHPSDVVNVNEAIPPLTAVTKPVGFIVATPLLSDDQLPPDPGVNLVDSPMHKESCPSKFMAGTGFTFIANVSFIPLLEVNSM